jgi:hypothetical protein
MRCAECGMEPVHTERRVLTGGSCHRTHVSNLAWPRRETVTLCAERRQLFRKRSFRMGWDVRVRIAFFVTVAIGAIGLGAAPEAVSEPPSYLSGCGSGFYRNSDGDCIPDPSKSPPNGLPTDGAPGLNTAPGFVGGTGPGVETAPGFGGVTPGGPPPGATARCRDGDYSYSTHHSGTCSRHGGVSQWLAG